MVFLIIFLILIILVLLYLLMLMTGNPGRARSLHSVLYAHRGYHNMALNIPENSLSAFRRAQAFGYGVELDIQLTKDHKVVVFHDETLKRMCGIERNVRDCTYEQLQKYNLLGTGERIPLFEDVLKLLDKSTPILCELKIYGTDTDMSICRYALPLLLAHREHLVIESFHPLVLFWFRKNAPQIVRGQLSCNFRRSKDGPNPFLGFLLRHMVFNIFTLPDFISYRHSDRDCISLRLIETLYRPVMLAWTLRNEREQRVAAKNGFCATIFEGYQAIPYSPPPAPPKPNSRG